MRLWPLAFLLVACEPKDGNGTDPVDEPEEEVPLWTEGPEVPECSAQTGAGDLVALSGVLLVPDGVEAGSVVYSRSSGRITCVGECDHTDADVVCTDGVISPALIEAHNHLQYNVIGRWDHPRLYENRYDWQSDGRYWDFRSAYDELWDTGAYTCEIHKWAEVRIAAGGATAAVGADFDEGECADTLVRNLDESLHGLTDYDMVYSSGRVTWLDGGDADDLQDELNTGIIEGYAAHVAEGISGTTRDEIDFMADLDLLGPGIGFVHATDATTDQLAQLATSETTIIWSPRSNVDLYAETTPVDVAATLGARVAIGTDWTWSGSAHPSQELQCAWDWLQLRGGRVSDQQVWEMATGNAAEVLGLDGAIGFLEEGMLAEIAVFDWQAEPYRAVIESGPAEVKLVLREGEPLYGDVDLVDATAAQPDWCDALDGCGVAKKVCIRNADSGEAGQRFDEVESTLASALDDTLFPAIVCEEPRAACDAIADVTEDDPDGDGVVSGDVCPDAYDPRQRDHDQDGVGDACDPCPLGADEEDCEHTAGDIDGDGLADGNDSCPTISNPSQSDGDSDGKGDACDFCPSIPNPGSQICPPTVDAINNPDHPDHPQDGAVATLSGLVVTGVGDDGFFAQDPGLSAWAGLYLRHDNADVAEGDEIEVTGTIADYFGMTALEDISWDVTGSGTVEPTEVSNPCNVETGGSDAERLEGMLLTMGPVTVSDENPDAPDNYGEFELDDCLRVDDMLCPSCDQPAEGTTLESITGPLFYSFGNSKLLPRSTSDLVE